jgi:hypothetical protein
MPLHRAVTPEQLGILPLDDAARAGGFQLILGGGQFAVARFVATEGEEGRWLFASGAPVPFEPEGYRP